MEPLEPPVPIRRNIPILAVVVLVVLVALGLHSFGRGNRTAARPTTWAAGEKGCKSPVPAAFAFPLYRPDTHSFARA